MNGIDTNSFNSLVILTRLSPTACEYLSSQRFFTMCAFLTFLFIILLLLLLVFNSLISSWPYLDNETWPRYYEDVPAYQNEDSRSRLSKVRARLEQTDKQRNRPDLTYYHIAFATGNTRNYQEMRYPTVTLLNFVTPLASNAPDVRVPLGRSQ